MATFIVTPQEATPISGSHCRRYSTLECLLSPPEPMIGRGGGGGGGTEEAMAIRTLAYFMYSAASMYLSGRLMPPFKYQLHFKKSLI